MDIPAGWHELDFSGRFDHLDTHFTDHVGPLLRAWGRRKRGKSAFVSSRICAIRRAFAMAAC